MWQLKSFTCRKVSSVVKIVTCTTLLGIFGAVDRLLDVLIRALVVAFTVAALWWSSNSFGLGLGLGELKIDSNLAAPLKASITLRGLSGIDLDPDQFSIRIESDSKAKIEYRLLRMGSDSAIIQLYTREIISDPLFQFRVEVKWDSSAVARSYDVLVDPPAYQEYFRSVDETGLGESVTTIPALSVGQTDEGPADNQNTQQVKPAIALSDDSAPETAAITVANTAVMEKQVGVPVAVDVNSLSSQQRREYGPTIGGNSIWRVARAVATDNPDLTIYQWMYAIWNNNPDAFTHNNMHRLKMEEVLDIPFDDQVAATSHSSAWRAYSEQMVVLQTASPVKPDAENATAVDALQDVPAVAEVQEVDAQQSSNSGEAVVNEFSPNAMPEPQTPTAEGSIIVLHEESASTMDEESVVTREIHFPPPTDEVAMSVDPITADELPAVDSNGISISAGVDSTNKFGGVTATRVDLKIDPILVESVDAEMTGNSLSTAVPENEASVDAAPVAANVEEMPEWSRALQERYDHINQLPVIGTDGALSFVGRSVQAADRFIATRPSWATLAFGIWFTLVLIMLRQEILSRRKTAVAASAAVLPEALGADETAKQKETDQDSARVDGEVEHVEQPVAVPIAPAAPSNAPAIIAQADTILARGDTEEAIKLMRLAVELQPGQPTLVIYLLELYHRTRSPELFAELIDRSSYVLEALDSSDHTRLEVMHAQLCPDAAFPLGRSEPAANHEMPVGDNADRDNADTESESLSELVAEMGAPSDLDAIDDSENEEFLDTQVIFTNTGVPLREQATPMPGMVGEILDQDVTLNEADVYLAYGLYENAQELLLKGIEADPGRVDFLARLLDTYYATRNVVDFVACAEMMLDMGEAGADYWERVEIMGYELAPYNNLFADGKDKSLSPVELEIPRPEIADFEFSDIDEGDESDFTDIEMAPDIESTPGESTLSESTHSESTHSESTIADIRIGKYLDDNSEPADLNLTLNLDLETHELNDDGDSLLDELISELDDLTEADESGMADDDESFEIDLEATTDDFDPALTVNLEAAEVELKASISDVVADEVAGYDEVIDLADDDEDAIEFTMNQDSLGDDPRSEQFPPVDSDDASVELIDDSTVDTLFGVKLGSDNSRILYFPDSPSEDRDINEFESEVKMTLQAIRDQLQNTTERLFHQERSTSDLKQTIAELKGDNLPAAKNGKKSN
jgi:FimV-like protein